MRHDESARVWPVVKTSDGAAPWVFRYRFQVPDGEPPVTNRAQRRRAIANIRRRVPGWALVEVTRSTP